jgi:putative membrane-bound dehydrogenase-like protein
MYCLRRLFVALSMILLPHIALAQVPPDKAVSTFKVVDGLEISLWASEPLFANPTSMDIDHRGRVWVCESVNYRHTLHRRKPLRPAGDRILILEDSKGTGKADKVTVFYQSPEILAPLGIAVAKDPVGPGYKVFVCQSPNILLFEDKDGKGKADGPPKKLLTGFRGIDHDHGVHGILIGPDNKLYFSVGDQGVGGLKGKDGKKTWNSNSTDCRAGTIWRCELDGSHLELIAHNFRNEYEPCVDSFGTVFVSDNDDDGNQQTRICYVMPGGNYGYHPRGRGESHWHEEQPGVVPKILRTYFGSPTGMCVYEGTLLPKKYQGQLLHTDAGPRHVRCYHLTPEGASYAVDREDMVTSTDNWFRPSDICVAPDGSVYVADWYDPGVGGHGMGDTTRGRVYRIAPKGHRPHMPKVNLKSFKGLLEALGSPALSVRHMAMAKIQMAKEDEAVQLVFDLLRTYQDKKVQPWLRARAVWQIGLLDKRINSKLSFHCFTMPLIRVMEDKDPRFRCLAIRIWKDVIGTAPIVYRGEKSLLPDLSADPSAAVRRELLLALRDMDPKEAKPHIIQMAKQYDGKDRFYLAAIGIAVGHHDKSRRDVILADFDKQFPEWNEKVAGLVWELRPPQVVPLLEKRLGDNKLPLEQRKHIVDIVASSPEPDAGKVLLKALGTGAPAEVRERILANLKFSLPAKWKALARSNELSATVAQLLKEPETRLDGLTLIGAAEKMDAIPQVTAIAKNTKEPLALRTAAVQTLGLFKVPQATTALVRELLGVDPVALRIEVVAALGRQDTPAALEALQGLVTAVKFSLELKQAAVAALAGSRRGSVWLLAANERKQLPNNLKDDVGRLLRNSPFQPVRNKALIAFPPPGRLDPKKLPSIAKLLGRKGNAARGRELVAVSLKSNLQCLKCHTIRGLGGSVGPDLSVIGKKASRENLFESILYPSKAIADQYVTWVIETVKGENITGLIVGETPEHVIVRDGNGKDYKVQKKDIDTKTKSTVSLMPADLMAYMTEDDLVDIVDYLFNLKTPALTLDYWHLAGPFDNGANDAGLDTVFPPEKIVDLKATYAGKSGKVGWRIIKPDGKSYVDIRAFLAGRSDNVVSYLYRQVESPVDQKAEVLLGTDDCAKLWVNGKLVYTNRAHGPAMPEKDRVKIQLKKGKNMLLLKVTNGSGDHGFYLTVMADEELKKVDLMATK